MWATGRAPALNARLALRRQTRGFARLHFLAVCLQTGILDELREPLSVEQLAGRLRLVERESLRTLLRLGVALKELDERKDLFRPRGSLCRALQQDGDGALRATLLEIVDYHGLVYRNAALHLREGQREPYLSTRAELIQSSSRIVEPALTAFVRGLPLADGDRRVLELGCGSAVYLRRACESGARVSGVGVEADARVARLARENIERWGLRERVRIVHCDARMLPSEIGGEFDLATLYNNVYYFDAEERPSLFRQTRSRLRPGGQLAIVTMLRGNSVAALQLDLVLASTQGCSRLPTASELRAALAAGGFARVRERRLLPAEPFVALLCDAV